MPSADPKTTESPEGAETTADDSAERDEAREALLEALTSELGEAIVGQQLIPGRDLWIRVATGAWSDTAEYLRNRQRFRFFDWLSAIDWLPSPYGRSLDAAVDTIDTGDTVDTADTVDTVGGDDVVRAAGGETRFQVMARVYSLATGIGLHVKADVGDDLTVGTWAGTYPGAHWHERETHEMFGISFAGNPDLRNLYLPGAFEGYPLRKDFPLMARLVKPWPGIIDVEPMPEIDEGDEGDKGDRGGDEDAKPSTENPEDAS